VDHRHGRQGHQEQVIAFKSVRALAPGCPKKSNAVPGQPPGTASYVVSCSAFVTAGRRNDRFGPSTLRRASHLPKPSCRSATLRSRTCNCCGGQRPCPAPKSGKGEEAATPGQPVAHPRSWSVPRRFTLENHRLPLALPQSLGKLRKHSRFRCTHSQPECRAPQYKKSAPLCRNCGRCDFPVEYRGKLEAITRRTPEPDPVAEPAPGIPMGSERSARHPLFL
jgi:hypothetical protein